MDKCVPSKITSTTNNLAWLYTKFRRMIKKKQRMYNKAKMSKKKNDWEHYNTQTNKKSEKLSNQEFGTR